MSAKYKFYEVVKVVSSNPDLAEINNQEAAIMGMVENNNSKWSYAVHILETEDGWDVDEEELQSTGRMMCESDFYDGESVTVVVDSKTGTGMIK